MLGHSRFDILLVTEPMTAVPFKGPPFFMKKIIAILISCSILIDPSLSYGFSADLGVSPVQAAVRSRFSAEALVAPFISRRAGGDTFAASVTRLTPRPSFTRPLRRSLTSLSIVFLTLLNACTIWHSKTTPTIDPLAGESRSDRYEEGAAMAKQGLNAWHLSPDGPIQITDADSLVYKVLESRAVADKAAGGMAAYLKGLAPFAVDYKWGLGLSGPAAAILGKGKPEYTKQVDGTPLLEGALNFYPIETAAGHGWSPRGIWNTLVSVINGSTLTDKNTINGYRQRALSGLAEAYSYDKAAQQDYLDSVRVAWHRYMQIEKAEFDIDELRLNIAARQQVLREQRQAKAKLGTSLESTTEAEPVLASLSQELDRRRWFRDSVATALVGQVAWTPREATSGLAPLAHYRPLAIDSLATIARLAAPGTDSIRHADTEAIRRALRAKLGKKLPAKTVIPDPFTPEGERFLLKLFVPGFSSNLYSGNTRAVTASVEELTTPLPDTGLAKTPGEEAAQFEKDGLAHLENAADLGMKPSAQLSLFSLLTSVGHPWAITGALKGNWGQDMSQSKIRKVAYGALRQEADLREGTLHVKAAQGNQEAEARRQAALARAATAYQAIARNSQLFLAGLRAGPAVNVNLTAPVASIAIAQRQAAAALAEANQALRQGRSFRVGVPGGTDSLLTQYTKHRKAVTEHLRDPKNAVKDSLKTKADAAPASAPAQPARLGLLSRGIVKIASATIFALLLNAATASAALAMNFTRVSEKVVKVTAERGDDLSHIAIKILRAQDPTHPGNFSWKAIKEMYNRLAQQGGINPHHLRIGQSFDISLPTSDAVARLTGEASQAVSALPVAPQVVTSPLAPTIDTVHQAAQQISVVQHPWLDVLHTLTGGTALTIYASIAVLGVGIYVVRRLRSQGLSLPFVRRGMIGLSLLAALLFGVNRFANTPSERADEKIEVELEAPKPVLLPPQIYAPKSDSLTYVAPKGETGVVQHLKPVPVVHAGDILVGWSGKVSGKDLKALNALNRRWKRLGFKTQLVDAKAIAEAREQAKLAAKAPIQIRSLNAKGSVDSRLSFAIRRLTNTVASLERARQIDAFNRRLDPTVGQSLASRHSAAIAKPLGRQIQSLLPELSARNVRAAKDVYLDSSEPFLARPKDPVTGGQPSALLRLPSDQRQVISGTVSIQILEGQRDALSAAVKAFQRLSDDTKKAQAENPISGAEFEKQIQDAKKSIQNFKDEDRRLEERSQGAAANLEPTPSGRPNRMGFFGEGPLATIWLSIGSLVSLFSRFRRRRRSSVGEARMQFAA